MKRRHQLSARVAALAAALLLAATTAAFAQLQTGNVYGKVSDQQGAALPGVTVTLDTGAAQEVQVTNAQGEFRFLSLPPATMKLKAELQGFGTLEYPNVVITVGHNTTLELTLNSAVEDVITVTTESPLLDERKISTGATVSGTELQEIPTSRDPWTILSTTPGVLVDRLNIAGNESGQQSIYVGPGAMNGQSVWSMDGVVMTDMAALGSSPSYYDFDAFQEMQVTTGGTDTTIATGGVVINMVTKRGTNQWRGSGRFFDTPGSTAAASSFNSANFPAGQTAPAETNHIVKVQDYGAEVGGPIVKDHLWIWGSYGNQDVETVALGGVPNTAKLPTFNGKLNAQITASNSATFYGLENNKTVNGRDAGPARSQETTWNQSRNGPEPTAGKLEDTQIFGANFYLTGMISDVNGGFQLVPQGFNGYDPNAVTYFDAGAVAHDSFVDLSILRPQKQAKLDASSFFNLGGTSNELKYGAGYRQVQTSSLSTFGAGLIYDGSLFGLPAGENLYVADREENLAVRNTYTSAYAQDTLTVGNLTANIGLRYDRQGGSNLPSFEAASLADPAILPAVSYGGGPIGFTWSNFTPRLGLTYALGKDRTTLVRASYSRYADQMSAAIADGNNPMAAQSYYYFLTPSSNIGPGLPTSLLPGSGYSGNVNPLTGLPFANRANEYAPNFSAPLTDEVLASVEHSILPELVVGLNLTYRHLSNLIPWQGLGNGATGDLLVYDVPITAACPSGCAFDPSTLTGSVGRPATAADYYPITTTVTLPNGQQSSLTYWMLKPGVVTHDGTYITNSNQVQNYEGASLTFNKRLSNHWMMRGNFTVSNWTAGGDNGLANPTDFLGSGNVNGDQIVTNSAGSGAKAYVFISSKYSYNLNGMYQVASDRPWGFNLAGNWTGHQGYAMPYFINTGSLSTPNPTNSLQFPGDTVENITIGRPDAQRLPWLNDFDARIEKEFSFQDFGLTLSVDCFNLFNSSTVLQQVSRAEIASSGDIYEILSPRIYRFGVRLSFR
jgi:Carboxypeptidase regulatory-like domain